MSGSLMTGSKYLHISAVNTGTIKGAPGSLISVVINTKIASGVLTLYDSVNPGGTAIIAVIDCSGATTSLAYRLDFATGLSYALAGGNADITISFA